ncbi:MAG TPA: HAD family phosphatase [Gemmatimonadaceae bacterium]|jgi:HAD superfamily hydrolase (TIGR01509 family)|nr:HAD family phosphatase [Gemmatimonadaceae bacterium]
MLQAVLLEFEGVIADTREARKSALSASLADEGIVLDDWEYAEHCLSLPVRGATREALALRGIRGDETRVDLATLRAERRFAELVGAGASLVPGAVALVESIHSHARVGLVSRAARREIEPVLSLAGIDHAFEFVIADDDPFPPKPSPAGYGGALERLARRRAVVPRNVVALEDGRAGIRAAKGAGLRCAVVGLVPAHLAMDADALLPTLVGQTAVSIDSLTSGERTADR